MSSPSQNQAWSNLGSLPIAGATERQRLTQLNAERARRRIEAIRIYRPLPSQLPFHASAASERVVRGGNQSGKSASSFMEVASAATGIPLTAPDGSRIPYRYPTDRPLLIWVIGYDQKHIGQTIHRMLFTSKNGLSMIRDKKTGEWRSWQPWDEDDLARENESRPMPAFIPERFIDPKGWAWESKGDNVFTRCTLKPRPEWGGRFATGTEILAFSSKGEAKQGDQVDLIHIDEDIAFSKHVGEWQARLSKRRGRLIWSAFPHSKNRALIDLSRRAKEQKSKPNPDVHEVVLRFSDNPFMPEDEKRKRLDGWSDAERAARDEGEFATDNVLMYPTFSPGVHGSPSAGPETDSAIDSIIRNRGNQIPDDWTRYLVLDPGHSQAAVLFAAVPPSEFGDHIVLYDELYPKHTDAYELARRVLPKVQAKYFEAFIIDFRAGRQTPMGFGHDVRQQYAGAFAKSGIRSNRTGSTFLYGSDNVRARVELVRSALTIRGDGTTRLKVVTATTPNLQREFELYSKKVASDDVKEEPLDRDNHLMNCLEYLVAFNPGYVRPAASSNTNDPVLNAFLKMKKSREKSTDSDTVYMGAGTAAMN